MELSYRPQTRADRMINGSRLVIAVFTLLAVFIDPELAGRGQFTMIAVAVIFLDYAALILLVTARWLVVPRWVRMASHVADFFFFSLLLVLTQGALSGFFSFFIFSLLSAVLRFGARGTVITGVAAILVFSIAAAIQGVTQTEPALVVVRVTALGVITTLLVYFRSYHDRTYEELKTLSAWGRDATGGREGVAGDMLRLTRRLVGAPRGVLVWEEGEEPWLYVAYDTSRQVEVTREPPDPTAYEVPAGYSASTALITDPASARSRLESIDGRIADSAGALSDVFIERFHPASLITSPVVGGTIRGRLFLFDIEDVSFDDLTLTEIAAGLIAGSLEDVRRMSREQESAIVDDRVRVARDLHDGLLQSLTGVALQLQALQNVAESDGVRERLHQIQEAIAIDQRDLRRLIEELRPVTPQEIDPSLRGRLDALASRARAQWQADIRIDVDDAAAGFSERLSREVFKIVSEGVANAVRHAEASVVEVVIRAHDGTIAIEIRNDGRGFPFHGKFDLFELERQRRGPVTLKQRVASLGGKLTLTSSGDGSTIEISLPG